MPLEGQIILHPERPEWIFNLLSLVRIVDRKSNGKWLVHHATECVTQYTSAHSQFDACRVDTGFLILPLYT